MRQIVKMSETVGLHCLMRSFGYEALSHQTWVKRPASGATETDPTGGGATGNNMVVVTKNQYDNGVAGRDGNLTSTWAWVDGSTSRQTDIVYDFRNRQTSVTGEENAYSDTTYDNLNRPLVRQTRNGSAAAVLLSKSQTDYDNRGRVYRKGIVGAMFRAEAGSKLQVPCTLKKKAA